MTKAIKRNLEKRGLIGVKANNLQQAGGVKLATKEKGMALSEQCGCIIWFDNPFNLYIHICIYIYRTIIITSYSLLSIQLYYNVEY